MTVNTGVAGSSLIMGVLKSNHNLQKVMVFIMVLKIAPPIKLDVTI